MNWTALAWFAAIVVSIPLVLWLFKRSHGLGAGETLGTARTVAVLPLSPQQKVVTVEVGRGDDKLWLVLGVTASNITTLHTMTALPPPVPAPGRASGLLPPTIPGAVDEALPRHGPASATFAQLLRRLRGAGGASPRVDRRRGHDGR